ncbi:MAG: hypothetical protein A2Z97_07720 [Bdellovibrionales bacterium GWB1_52_6]|nr:MAG: hypothetical protein A2Z97_07720 [Bdellovibrionales bacterium GWB1_52_6]OFZ04767.1 MAG: hypothetical protein A2X97_13660 [Bdellovibrionales bacterium GWA1_52_35]HCM39581.1 hypothetical protein [Bdellovibrionales bacterium]
MHLIHWLMRFFPYWAIPAAFILGELALHFRRKKSAVEWFCWGMVLLLIILIVLWVAMRGDLHSDQWVKSAF